MAAIQTISEAASATAGRAELRTPVSQDAGEDGGSQGDDGRRQGSGRRGRVEVKITDEDEAQPDGDDAD